MRIVTELGKFHDMAMLWVAESFNIGLYGSLTAFVEGYG